MTDTHSIRRRPDGSIDTAHYMAKGRQQRANQARALTAMTVTTARRPALGLGALLAMLPFLPGQN